MRSFRILLSSLCAAAVALGASTGGSWISAPRAEAAPASVPDASVWTIGPIIKGRNYSQGVPLQPTRNRAGGWYIDIPGAPGSVHYVTFPHGSLAGKSRIRMRFKVDLAPGAQIVPLTAPQAPSMLTLYFQRAGDGWSIKRGFEDFRWYATFATLTPITPGEHEIVAPLTANWTAVQSSSARNNPGGFAAAVNNADQVGFVLGGGDGYGHGVFATGPARITVTTFRVE